ncbi:hypothetical protein PINS_up004491 [Pythium insidiosum]|nr:hypothetical protein PINS_up004491 [Pythium insidiosum]
MQNDARSLQTLPSAEATQRLAHSESKIDELLDHAHRHVDLVVEILEGRGVAAGSEVADTDVEVPSKQEFLLLHFLKRTKRKVTRLLDPSSQVRDARFRRLRQGYETLVAHVNDTEYHLRLLQDALDALHEQSRAIESSLPPPMAAFTDDELVVSSVEFGKIADVVRQAQLTLGNEVAPPITRKITKLHEFQVTLDQRKKLLLDTEIARKEYQQLLLDSRNIDSVSDSKLAQLRALQRRLDITTAAIEHVFEFHARLDRCVVEPEMRLVHQTLFSLFDELATVLSASKKT